MEAGKAGFLARYQAHQARQLEAARREEQARAFVGSWDALWRDYGAALPRLVADPGLGGTRAGLQALGRALADRPQLVGVLRERGAEFGLGERPELARVVAAREPGRELEGVLEAAEGAMRGQLQRQAQQAAEQAARRAEEATRQSARQQQRPSRGPSMGP